MIECIPDITIKQGLNEKEHKIKRSNPKETQCELKQIKLIGHIPYSDIGTEDNNIEYEHSIPFLINHISITCETQPSYIVRSEN